MCHCAISIQDAQAASVLDQAGSTFCFTDDFQFSSDKKLKIKKNQQDGLLLVKTFSNCEVRTENRFIKQDNQPIKS